MGRTPRLIVVLALGLAVLLWGMVSLQRIFMRERSDAIASLEGRQQALEQFARRELEQMLRDELAAAAFDEIDVAAKDPLAPADGLYLQVAGRQVLPRPSGYAAGDATPAFDLYTALTAGRAPDTDADDPFAERLGLLKRFRAALETGDRGAIESGFRAILLHRTRFVVSATRDVPFTLVLVEQFLAKSKPDRDVLRKVVREGIGEELPGLMHVLLERRAKFTKSDFERIAKKIIDVSSELEARHDDFELAAFGEPETAPVFPEPLEKPMLVAGRTWYVEPVEEGRVEGIAVDLPLVLDAITVEMRDRALMTGSDRIAADPPSDPAAETIAALPLRAESPEWLVARTAIARNYRIKSALSVALASLAIGVAALALLLQARERRFLALKSDFVATVSHELRTPLAAVRLLAETLEKKLAGTPEARDYPGRIVQEVDSLSFLVENILSFNRLDKGKVVPRLSEVRLAELVDMVRMEAPLRTTTPVSVTSSAADDVVFIADSELMKLLFLNLASNACKHNKRTPVEIAIAYKPPASGAEASAKRERGGKNGGSTLAVDFRDNGVGISPDDRERVFEDFYRGTTGARGFGLGLAICRRIMHLHGGEIRVADSSADGTRFEMTFPVNKGSP